MDSIFIHAKVTELAIASEKLRSRLRSRSRFSRLIWVVSVFGFWLLVFGSFVAQGFLT
jgi:hypothetical protein